MTRQVLVILGASFFGALFALLAVVSLPMVQHDLRASRSLFLADGLSPLVIFILISFVLFCFDRSELFPRARARKNC